MAASYPSYMLNNLFVLRTNPVWRGKWSDARTLATAVGLSVSHYRRIEQGRGGTSGPVVQRLAKLLHVTPALLVEGPWP